MSLKRPKPETGGINRPYHPRRLHLVDSMEKWTRISPELMNKKAKTEVKFAYVGLRPRRHGNDILPRSLRNLQRIKTGCVKNGNKLRRGGGGLAAVSRIVCAWRISWGLSMPEGGQKEHLTAMPLPNIADVVDIVCAVNKLETTYPKQQQGCCDYRKSHSQKRGSNLGRGSGNVAPSPTSPVVTFATVAPPARSTPTQRRRDRTKTELARVFSINWPETSSPTCSTHLHMRAEKTVQKPWGGRAKDKFDWTFKRPYVNAFLTGKNKKHHVISIGIGWVDMRVPSRQCDPVLTTGTRTRGRRRLSQPYHPPAQHVLSKASNHFTVCCLNSWLVHGANVLFWVTSHGRTI